MGLPSSAAHAESVELKMSVEQQQDERRRARLRAVLDIVVFMASMATILTLALSYVAWLFEFMHIESSPPADVADVLVGGAVWSTIVVFALHIGAMGSVPWLRAAHGASMGCAVFLAIWVPLVIRPAIDLKASLCLPVQTLIPLDVAPLAGSVIVALTVVATLKQNRRLTVIALALGVVMAFGMMIALELPRYAFCGNIV